MQPKRVRFRGITIAPKCFAGDAASAPFDDLFGMLPDLKTARRDFADACVGEFEAFDNVPLLREIVRRLSECGFKPHIATTASLFLDRRTVIGDLRELASLGASRIVLHLTAEMAERLPRSSLLHYLD